MHGSRFSEALRVTSVFALTSCLIEADLPVNASYWMFAASTGASTERGLQYEMKLVQDGDTGGQEVWLGLLYTLTSDEDVFIYSMWVDDMRFRLEANSKDTCRWRLDGRIDSDSFLCGTFYECTDEAAENVITRTFGARRIKNPGDYHEQAYVNCDREAVDWQLER
ncbi:MAG: hypothetical protein JNL82_22830 [Myxococcales bacterium]|nr:hypothetical protein [Myxococcales bacterium]